MGTVEPILGQPADRTPPERAAVGGRVAAVDVARGVAFAAMAIYHLSWDLMIFQLVYWPVEDGLGWRIFRTLIAGSFLGIVGIGLVLAGRGGLNLGGFLRRLGWIVAAAVAISVITWLVMPATWIFFGILHSIAVVSVLGLLVLRWPCWALALLAVVAAVLPEVAADPLFNQPGLSWTGLVTIAPVTNDYVPVLPWIAWMFGGMALARLALFHAEALAGLWRWRPGSAVGRTLSWVGRHALPLYLLHQPVLIALVAGFVAVSGMGNLPMVAGGEAADTRAGFRQACVASCQQTVPTGTAIDVEGLCSRHCACLAERADEAGLLAGPDTEESRTAMVDLAHACFAEAEGEGQ